MANMVFTSDGLLRSLANALWDVSGIYNEDWWVDLFKSNTTVAYASVKADFTLADFTGYSRFSWTRSDMVGVGVFTGDTVRTLPVSNPSYTCTGGTSQTVYGWIMYGKTSDLVWCGQNFDTPRVMTAGAVEALNPFRFYMKTIP